MIEQKKEDTQIEAAGQSEVLRFASVILRHRKKIFFAVVGAMLAGSIVFWVKPKIYTARTVLVPSTSKTSARSQLASQFPLALSGIAGGAASDQNLVKVVLKSRSLADSMVNRLAGKATGATASEGVVRRILGENTNVTANLDGSIVIDVSAKDPQLATRIANTFPELVNVIVAEMGHQTSIRKQTFLENQLVDARDRLLESEQRLSEFQRGRDAPEVQEQAKSTIQAAAELQRGIIQKEIEVAQLRRTATADNPELRAATAELNAQREQLQRLMSGQRNGNQVFVPLRESPELKVVFARHLRDFTKNEQVFTSLTAALAEAQIEVNDNLPVISVLDPAIVPDSPSGWSLGSFLGIAGLLGLFAGVVAALASDYAHNARLNPKNESFFAAWDQFKADLSAYLPHRRSRRVAASPGTQTEERRWA